MAACVALTTSGLTLINWQNDSAFGAQSAPLPLRSICFPMLGPLLASLVQFSRGAEFGYVELSAGVHVAMSTDPVTQVTVAVLFRSTDTSDRELARLKSLVVLQQLVGSCRDAIERLVDAHAKHSQAMSDSYTLTQALEGLVDDGDDVHETKSEFLAFERSIAASTMQRRSALDWSLEALPPAPATCQIIRVLLLNAETGNVLESADMETDAQTPDRWLPAINSARCTRLVAHAALALHESFSLLYRSCLLKRPGRSSLAGFSSLASSTDGSPPVLTLLVRLDASTASPTDPCVHFGLQMLPTGVFAAGVVFAGDAATISQQENVASADAVELQRVLMADARGARMLRLLQGSPVTDADNHRQPRCKLFLGASGVPESAAKVLEAIVHSWVPPPPPLARDMDTFGHFNNSERAQLDQPDWGSVASSTTCKADLE